MHKVRENDWYCLVLFLVPLRKNAGKYGSEKNCILTYFTQGKALLDK